MIMTVFVCMCMSTCVCVCVYEYVRVCLWGQRGMELGFEKEVELTKGELSSNRNEWKCSK